MTARSRIVCTACGSVNGLAAGRDPLGAKCGKCGTALFVAAPSDVTAAAFELHVSRSDIPLLVDVWAPWCGPCHQMAPMFERAARGLEPHVRLLKLNADEAPQICARFGVRSIPALLLLHAGGLVAQTAGVMDTRRILNWTQAHLPHLKETFDDAR